MGWGGGEGRRPEGGRGRAEQRVEGRGEVGGAGEAAFQEDQALVGTQEGGQVNPVSGRTCGNCLSRLQHALLPQASWRPLASQAKLRLKGGLGFISWEPHLAEGGPWAPGQAGLWMPEVGLKHTAPPAPRKEQVELGYTEDNQKPQVLGHHSEHG